MSEHTPGPWVVAGTRHSGNLEIGKDTRLHWVGPDGDAVCGVFYDMNTHRGWADARLIAAAPELLAALGDFVKMGESYGWDSARTGREYLMKDARAAIAKAKGQSQ